jgi:hypothetical protein
MKRHEMAARKRQQQKGGSHVGRRGAAYVARLLQEARHNLVRNTNANMGEEDTVPAIELTVLREVVTRGEVYIPQETTLASHGRRRAE